MAARIPGRRPDPGPRRSISNSQYCDCAVRKRARRVVTDFVSVRVSPMTPSLLNMGAFLRIIKKCSFRSAVLRGTTDLTA